MRAYAYGASSVAVPLQRPLLNATGHPVPTLYAGRAVVFNGGMTQDQPMFNVRQFAAAARISVPEARLPALAAGLAATLDSMERLLALEYGDTEPAARFRLDGRASARPPMP